MAASVGNFPRLKQMIMLHTQRAGLKILCNARSCNNAAFALQLRTIGLLNKTLQDFRI